MALVAGAAAANTLDTEINLTRDYIAQRTNTVTPISNGGTGATNASAARTALGVPATAAAIGAAADGIGTGLRFTSPGFNRLVYDAPGVTGGTELARQDDVSSRVSKSGDTMTGDLFLPNSSAATSGYTTAYINGDGRVSRGASSARYKNILDENPDVSGLTFPNLREFAMKGDEAQKPTLGYIAEEFVGTPNERFVVRVNGEVESIDFIQLLLAQVANLSARVEALEAGLT